MANTDDIRQMIINADTVATLVEKWIYTNEKTQLSILTLFIRLMTMDAESPLTVTAQLQLSSTLIQHEALPVILAMGDRPDVRFKRRVAKLLSQMSQLRPLKLQLARAGVLKMLLVLRTIQDKQTKKFALAGIFALLEDQDILSGESLDSEISQLMLALSQFGSEQIKKLAGKLVIRLARHHSQKVKVKVAGVRGGASGGRGDHDDFDTKM